MRLSRYSSHSSLLRGSVPAALERSSNSQKSAISTAMILKLHRPRHLERRCADLPPIVQAAGSNAVTLCAGTHRPDRDPEPPKSMQVIETLRSWRSTSDRPTMPGPALGRPQRPLAGPTDPPIRSRRVRCALYATTLATTAWPSAAAATNSAVRYSASCTTCFIHSSSEGRWYPSDRAAAARPSRWLSAHCRSGVPASSAAIRRTSSASMVPTSQ
jgi:hypothetical protein